MKVLLAARSLEDRGALARALARRGHDVLVLAGVAARADAAAAATRIVETRDDGVRGLRLERADPCPDHWQKSSVPEVRRLVRELLAAERPESSHVAHWRLLSRELVHLAALARVPAVVTLADDWSACPIATRACARTRAACDAAVGVHPCVACAGRVPPATPWVPREAQHLALAERQRDLERELALARSVLVPTPEHGERVRRFLGPSASRPAFEPVPDDDVDAHEAVYARARTAGAPAVAAPADDWFGERMRAFAAEQWDRALRAAESGSDRGP
ncbi:MAG: hypothetical protein IPJ77_11430 [Planctomycetes bacterium]|nr:hypothetical protein [Planctomycetota bacterium]